MARRVIRAVRDYADRWIGEQRYRLLVHLDPDWGRIYLFLAVQSLQEEGGAERVWSVMKEHLARAFSEEPELLKSCVLRVEDDRSDNPFIHYAISRFSDSEDFVVLDPVG